MIARPSGSLRPFYADWAGLNRRLVEGLRAMSQEDLALRPAGERDWPIWAIAGHTAAVRVFWLCDVFGEPGAEGTPFGGTDGLGWEDDLTHPRSAVELADAFNSTWQVVEGCLDRWSADSLQTTVRRPAQGRPPQVHTRQSILMRMITHEGYHLGEINLILGANGRPQIDPWPGGEWLEGVPSSVREG